MNPCKKHLHTEACPYSPSTGETGTSKPVRITRHVTVPMRQHLKTQGGNKNAGTHQQVKRCILPRLGAPQNSGVQPVLGGPLSFCPFSLGQLTHKPPMPSSDVRRKAVCTSEPWGFGQHIARLYCLSVFLLSLFPTTNPQECRHMGFPMPRHT